MDLVRVVTVAVLGLGGMALGSESDLRKALDAAATEVSYLSFESALPMFQKAAAQAPQGSDLWQQATFGQAVCLQQIAPSTPSRLAEASSLYSLLIRNYPSGKYTPQSMMAMGRIAELVDYLGDQPDRETARSWYEKAREASGRNSDLAHEATLRIAGTYIQTYDPPQVRKGLQILDDHLARYPDNPLASAMYQYAGNTWFWPLGDEKRAIDCYLKADAKGLLEVGREGPTYWRIANLAERSGKREIAVRYYTKIIQKTPTSGKAYESQLALKRLGAPVPPIEIFERNKPAAAAKVSE